MKAIQEELQAAWSLREKSGELTLTQALRIFHGPGDSRGPLSTIAIEKFEDHYWIFEWEKAGTETSPKVLSETVKNELSLFLKSKKAKSAVLLERPQKGVPSEPVVFLGQPPVKIQVLEGRARFHIRFLETRHPGLFLDHFPLRQWLENHAQGWKMLNTFAYTGSLSVASGLAGAAHVTTLDLSRPTLQWAQENWELNGLALETARFIQGDYFEWLPRLKRERNLYDCVILDPPSSSTSKNGRFSTSKDLQRLHEVALDVLAPEGVLITSINSANVSMSKFESDLILAARSRQRSFKVLRTIEQPQSFPSTFGDPKSRYLKGWILKAVN